MYVKRVAGAVAIATGVGMSALTFGVGLVNAAPLDPPPPCPNCQPGPGGPENGPQDNPAPRSCNPAPQPPRVGPGNPRGGGGQPQYEPPRCEPAA